MELTGFQELGEFLMILKYHKQLIVLDRLELAKVLKLK